MKKLVRIAIVILIIVVLIPVGIVFFRPSLIIPKDIAKKELTLPSSKFLNWRGSELHYADEGSGPTVLMIHGFGGSLRNFSNMAALLKDSFRVVRVDLPGFGLSDLPQGDEHPQYVQMYRDYISFMIDTLHLDSVIVMGNSMGGGVAWMMAADHPDKVKKLVLLNSAGYDIASVSSKLFMFRYKTVGHVFDKGMPLKMSQGGMLKCYADPSKVDMAVCELNNHFTNREGNIQNMLTLARANQFPDTLMIKQVQCPTLIVWGKQDAIIPVAHAANFHRDIKNSRVIIYDPCGHVPMQERAEDLKRDFIKFVNE